MKRFILFAILIVACLSAAAVIGWALRQSSSNSPVPSDNLITREIHTGNFSEIRVYRINVVYTQSETTSAVLEAPDNIIDLIDINIKDGKLTIGADEKKLLPRHNLKATLRLSSPSVNEIHAALSAKFNIPEAYTSDSKLDLEATTGGKIIVTNAKVKKFSAEASTGSNIKADSIMAVREAEVKTSTGSNIDIKVISTPELELTCSTGASCEINAGNISVLEAEASTGGYAKVGATVDVADIKASTGARIKCPSTNIKKFSATTGGSIDN